MMSLNKKGFTLVELLVVIAIIGILASVVLVSLNSARTRSRDARRIADINQLRTALESSYESSANPKEYPANLAALQTGGFISQVPNDPQSGTAYTYARCNNNQTFVLAATLENNVQSGPLANDVDASTCSTPCTDPIYCVVP